jgi:hypothetical protein
MDGVARDATMARAGPQRSAARDRRPEGLTLARERQLAERDVEPARPLAAPGAGIADRARAEARGWFIRTLRRCCRRPARSRLSGDRAAFRAECATFTGV